MNPAYYGEPGNPPDYPDLRCECGAVEDMKEFCSADRCPACCAEHGDCHVECAACHRYVDADEYDFEADRCIDCAVAAQERAERLAGRDECWREDQGRERYYEGKYGETR